MNNNATANDHTWLTIHLGPQAIAQIVGNPTDATFSRDDSPNVRFPKSQTITSGSDHENTTQRGIGAVHRGIGAVHRGIGAVHRVIGAVRGDIGAVQGVVGAVRRDIGAMRRDPGGARTRSVRWVLSTPEALPVSNRSAIPAMLNEGRAPF
jgi:hypothetical protein